MTRVLLVTGSRSLATIPGAEAWAREHIRRALEGAGLLIVGDAPGPDAWAWDEAGRVRVVRRRYVALGPFAGCVVVDGKTDNPPRWTTQEPRRWIYETSPKFIAANQRKIVATWVAKRYAAMMSDAVKANATRDVSVLYFADLAAECISGLVIDKARRAKIPLRQETWTRGTEHTAGLAERAGIVVERRTWLREMGSRDAV